MPQNTFFRFALVGIAVAALYVALYLAFQRLGLGRGAANLLAFGLAVLAQYVAQARFTYRKPLAHGAQILRFAVMIGAGLATSALITSVFAPGIGFSDALAAVLVACVLPLQNFILMTLWVFSNQQLRGGNAS
ncbi:MAG: GtrA family protein [Cypionkella sp.]